MPSDRSIYLDYNATAPMRDEALDAYRRVALECAGNASSAHGPGRAARAALDLARVALARAMNTGARTVVFTSGGTESDNMAIKGIALARGTGHIVTSAVEHPAVLETCRWLERNGFRVSRLPVDGNGRVSPGDVADAIAADTILVSVMWVNNETGVVEPVEEIGAIARQRGVLFHTDAVQAFGRVPMDLSAVPVDLVSISAHKFGGPKGAGAIVVRRGVVLDALVHGGGQEAARRGGTYNVPAAAAMAVAARLAVDEMEREVARLAGLRDRIEAAVLARVPRVRVNGGAADRVANTSNMCFDGAGGEAVLIGLDGRGIAASSASACAASHSEPSYVLMAMGLTRAEAEDSMRVSLGRLTTGADVDAFLDVLPGVVEHARSML